jgi:hypothetical protein
LLPGGFGHRPGRHYDRSARCLAERGGGEGLKLYLLTRKRGPKLSGGVLRHNESRGGAPKGERAPPSTQPHPPDAAIGWMRLSALRFPFFVEVFGSGVTWTRAQKRDENAIVHPPPR